MSDPEKSYHFEIVCTAPEKARQLQELLASYDVDAKVVLRKRHYVVYIKEGSQIVELLGLMGAHISLMQLENAVRQAEDIRYIQEKIGLDKLPMDLEETARLRLEHTEASLKELGDMLSPKVGKSGVNHRLRKLSQIADDLREGKEE